MKISPTVLVVEDEPAIGQLITINLRHNGFRPILAVNGVQAQDELDRALPSLIVLDWMLPGESGVELVRRWRANPRIKEIPVIFLTARSDEVDRVTGLNAGADDYLVKPFSVKELLARIRAVLRRAIPEPADQTILVGSLRLDLATHRVSIGDKLLKIRPTEFKLLYFLMHNTERVHSRGQLLDKVWGDGAYIEERTVDVHIKRLRQALEEAGAMIETVRGVGYRLTHKAETVTAKKVVNHG